MNNAAIGVLTAIGGAVLADHYAKQRLPILGATVAVTAYFGWAAYQDARRSMALYHPPPTPPPAPAPPITLVGVPAPWAV